MERTRNHQSAAFTRLELTVVLVILTVLASLLLPALSRAHAKAQRIHCVSHLKQIGIAYRVWANDHGVKYPAFTFTTNGWANTLNNSNSASFCWTNYVIMQNELGQSPIILTCPSDNRKPATNFAEITNNRYISYFIGVGSGTDYPESILGGDRNLGPGTVPAKNYGYSPDNGQGNDVTLSLTNPICWTLKMHSAGNPAGAGNILLGDASVQQVTSARLNSDYLRFATDAGNWPSNKIANTNFIRLIFP